MTLLDHYRVILSRFRPEHPLSPASTFIFGFVSPDVRPFSIRVNKTEASIHNTIDGAEYILYSDTATLTELVNPDAEDRLALIDAVKLRPDFPFKNYLISIFMNAFDLDIEGMDYGAKPFDGPFPFPPRYPAAENPFRLRQYQEQAIPVHDADSLPQLITDEHPVWIAMYNRAWEIAFSNLRKPESESGFIANFIDTAFNANSFMWDSCFMMMFGRYARRAFNFMGTLDNFYAKQHDDGFICREINTFSGSDLFQSHDPRSTGPDILAWTEWQDYLLTGDIQRIRDIFPVLIAYHRWWKEWRRHPDGSYWTSGWGSGMDNQTRVPDSEYHHRYYTWIDAMFQQCLNCQILLKMAETIERDEFNSELQTELDFLADYFEQKMWDDKHKFYFDRAPDGTLSRIKSIGTFWGFLCDLVSEEKAGDLMNHLQDENSFNRPHPVPTQSYDSDDYNPYGGYWLGGVWSPTNYMVLQGLSHRGNDALAHQIAYKHVEHVARVFEDSGTLYENYAPEHPQRGIPSQDEFVGWTGLSAITIPIEYLIGIRPMKHNAGLIWDIRLTERHGVLRYPFGQSNTLDLICEARTSDSDIPSISASTQEKITLDIRYNNRSKTITLEAGKHNILLED